MIETVPLAEGFGVELKGVGLIDVASSDAAYRAVRALFEEHSLLLFRGQEVSDDVQAAYSRAFGPLELVKVGSVGHGTFYSRLNNLDADGRVVPANHRQVWRARANQLWHTDSSFKKTPALASVLSARRLPSDGGETEFTSTRLAWALLPPERQAQLKDAIVTHSYANSRDQIHPELMTAEERAALPPVRWRMTWRNPVNDRRALYIASHAYRVEGLGDNEAKALLAALIAEATAPGQTYLHRWRSGDVVMWDNRATMHRGRPWPLDEARIMVRTTIEARDEDGVAELRPAT
jgi:alpha-ketoglutarate-dependent 2,4-dichlorophenoxyacetate dioxygenase